MVATDAWSCATWDSRAMVTLSRKRRCMRVLTVRRNHVAAADTPRPIAAPWIMPGRCSRTPLPSSISHNARSASGSAASCDSTNAVTIKRGSWRYPSLHSRHIDDNAGGSGSILSGAPGAPGARSRSGEDIIRSAQLLVRDFEALRLQIEHRPVAPGERHQLVVRAELDDPAVLEHADPISVADRGEAMGDQDGRAMPRGGEQAIEDLRFPAHIELCGRLVEQHHAGAELDGCQRSSERHALPLATGQVGAAAVAAGEHGVQCGEVRRSRGLERRAYHIVWRACGCHVVAQWQLQADEILEHGRDARAPRREIELAKVDAVNLDRTGLRIVQPAQQLGDRGLAGTVLSNDGQRRAGGNREIEVLQHGRARRVRERDIAETNLARRWCYARGAIARAQSASGTHGRFESEHRGDGGSRSIERPTESAKGDHGHTDGTLHVDDGFPETDAAMGGGARQ